MVYNTPNEDIKLWVIILFAALCAKRKGKLHCVRSAIFRQCGNGSGENNEIRVNRWRIALNVLMTGIKFHTWLIVRQIKLGRMQKLAVFVISIVLKLCKKHERILILYPLNPPFITWINWCRVWLKKDLFLVFLLSDYLTCNDFNKKVIRIPNARFYYVNKQQELHGFINFSEFFYDGILWQKLDWKKWVLINI